MSRRNAVAELLHALAAVMDEARLPWYLFGAQAAIIWGSPRLSGDVDVTAVIEPHSAPEFVRRMTEAGFDAVEIDARFLEQTRVLPFVHRATRMPLDIVLAGPGLEEEFLRRAIPVRLEGSMIPVVSPEDLIVAKVLAGRAKDIEDIRGVIHQRKATLDAERIRSLLGLLEEALTRGDLLPVFEKEWRDAGPPMSDRRPKRPK